MTQCSELAKIDQRSRPKSKHIMFPFVSRYSVILIYNDNYVIQIEESIQKRPIIKPE